MMGFYLGSQWFMFKISGHNSDRIFSLNDSEKFSQIAEKAFYQDTIFDCF